VILTVTPNPAIDMTWSVPRLVQGNSHRVVAGSTRAGGKGVNVARVLHGQGRAVRAITTVGGATGVEFSADLALAGLAHRSVPVAAPTRRSVALYDEARSETTIVNEAGACPSAAEWRSLTDAALELLPDCRCLVGSGSLPPGGPAGFLADLVRAARTAGIPTVIDTSGPALLAAAQAGATLLKPNAEELRDATGELDPVTGARTLLALGARSVLVSLGARGMLLVRAGDAVVRSARLPTPLTGNATGAGDAAVAAVAAVLAYDDDGDPERLLRLATAWSAAAVLMPLAGDISPSHPDLAARVVVEVEG
jgi:hypothetical protein